MDYSSNMRKVRHDQHKIDYNDMLIFSVIGNDLDQARYALQSGANQDVQIDRNISEGIHIGFTPLLIAATRNYPKMAELLIEFGADLNWSPEVKTHSNGKNSLPALVQAAWCYNDEVVDVLLAHNADVHGRDSKGRSAIIAVCEDYIDEHYGIVEKLLNAGSNPNDQDHNGYTPIMLAAIAAIAVERISPDFTRVARLLIKNGADIKLKNRDQNGLREIAFHFKQPDIFEFASNISEGRILESTIGVDGVVKHLEF